MAVAPSIGSYLGSVAEWTLGAGDGGKFWCSVYRKGYLLPLDILDYAARRITNTTLYAGRSNNSI